MKNDKAALFLERLESNGMIQNLILQADSRYILYNVQEPQENFPNYTVGLDEKLISIAISYLSIGCTFAENENGEHAIYSLEKGATILGNLYSPIANRNEYSSYFILASSLAYYAANQYSKSFVILKTIQFDTVVAELISLFLRRKYNELDIYLSEVFLSNDYSDSTIADTNDEEIANNKIYILILSKTLSSLLEYIISGEEKWLAKAKESLVDLLELVAIDSDPSLWWVIRLFHIIIDGFYKNSLWNVIPPEIGDNIIVSNYISTMVFQNNPIVELFYPQKIALPKIVEKSGAVFSLPTSSGKTRIAELAIVNLLSNEPNAKILYLAPFRSLAFEIEEALSRVFNPIGFDVSQLYDGPQFNKLDEIIIQETSVIIATPEKAKAMIRSNSKLKSNIKLLIIDEGHLLGANERYILSEMLIEELKLSIYRNNGKIALLSAVLPNTDDISKWISQNEENNISSDWRPSKQRFGLLEFTGSNVNIIWQGNLQSYNRKFINPFIIKKPRSEYVFPNNKREAVAISAVKLSYSGSVLIFVYRKNMVMTQAASVVEVMKNEEMRHVWSNTNAWNVFKMACEEEYGKKSKVLLYAEFGVLCHHGGLSKVVRISMEKLMRTSNPRIIIATTTLGQGVNIGVSTVIIANVWLGNPTPLSNSDFWNIAGRAGRSFVDREGKILFAVDASQNNYRTTRDRDLALDYFNEDQQENIISGLLYIVKYVHKVATTSNIEFDLLLQLIAENDYSSLKKEHAEMFEHLFDMIDDTLLTLNLEYCDENIVTQIDDLFRYTLAYIQAKHFDQFSSDDVLSFLKARNVGVLKLAGEPSQWRSLVSTSIPLRSVITLQKDKLLILGILEEYQNSKKKIDDLLIFLKEIEIIINKLPSKNFNSADIPEEAREKWMKGKSLSSLTDGLREKCNSYFGFTLPWAINAIVKLFNNADSIADTEEFEKLAVLVQLGLPNYLAVKIYLLGIHSRSAATELSNILEPSSEKLSTSELKSQLFEIISPQNFVSEETKKWLDVLKDLKNAMVSSIKAIPNFSFKNQININSNTLSVKQYGERIFLCSPQYDEKIEISVSEKYPFDKYANNMGIRFVNRDGQWVMESLNPYIKLT